MRVPEFPFAHLRPVDVCRSQTSLGAEHLSAPLSHALHVVAAAAAAAAAPIVAAAAASEAGHEGAKVSQHHSRELHVAGETKSGMGACA